MTGSMKAARFGAGVTVGVVTAVTALTFLASHDVAFARTKNVAVVGRVDSPLGLQGSAPGGAGPNVGVIFNLVDDSRRKTDVEVQYGADYNADGDITDDEFRIATEDRLDSRNTRKNKAPQLFTTAGDIGAQQQYIWKSLSDIGTKRLLTLEYALDPQGRPKPDPDNPGSFLFATGPDGITPIFAGVRVRVRAVRTVKDPLTGQKKKVTGDWAVSDSFGLNNNNAPSMTIDSVENNGVSVPTASDETVLIHWTAYDPDSEDLNGNGQMDVADGEDINGDGKLDCERIGVAFDYHRLAANEDPSTMTADQIAALSWLPCTRKVGVGDTDSLDARPGVAIPETGDKAGVCSAPPGVGRQWTFAWDSVKDVGTVYAKFVFRARPFDEKRENGDYAYMSSPVQLDNWRIFHQGGPNFRVDPLGSARVGHTVTAILSQNSATDPQDRGNGAGSVGFQEVLVAGGSNSVNGAAVTDLDRMQINLITAETTTVSRVARQMQYARSGHSATQLDDGRILIIGGFNSAGTVPLSTTEIYDPQTNSVVAGPNLIGARAKHTAVLLSSGDVAVFGGVGAGATPLATCELIQFQPYQDENANPINPSNWGVVSLPNLAVAQHSALAALLENQKVLVTAGIDAGGNGVTTAQLLDPLNDNDPLTPKTKDPVFSTVPGSLSVARKFATATVLHDGNVLFVGGSAGGSTGAVPAASMEIYNWQLNSFEPVTTAMAAPRAQHLALLLGDGSVLVAGGTAANPESASPLPTGDADIVRIGARDALTAQWAATLQQINGDLISARRLAAGATMDSGRVFLTGGVGTAGPIASSETYTPANGSNRAPRARTILPASEQAWLYGAPIYYRLTDPELDRVRTVIQFIDRTPTGERIWRACSPQVDTIGGDIAEFTADLTSTLTDDLSLAIDPVAHNTPGDHAFIWAMSRDIPRPAVGQSASPYNVRVIPFGAVRGTPSESQPITVLYNTKILPKILPFENYADQRPDVGLPAGALTPNQGGDIAIWVHLRDLDGGSPDTNGDLASCLFEYAVDKNSDGQIKDADQEFFLKMTPSGQPAGNPSTTNPQTGLQTYYNDYNDSGAAFGDRDPSKGWTRFDWDCLYDLGAPVTTFSNVWVRVTPSDANAGFTRTVRNLPGQPPALTIIKHPDSVYLLSWRPKYSNSKTAMPINDPIEFTFNGQVLDTSVTSSTLQVWRGFGAATSQVRGQYTTVNNGNNTATVTFFPDAQSLSTGSNVYAQTAASTVLYPNDDYSFRIPGYVAGTVPSAGTTIRPATYTNPASAGSTYSTYRLTHVLPINAGPLLNDPNSRFRTAAAGVYANDLFNPLNLTQSPTPVTTIIPENAGQPGSSASVSFTFNRALDPFTVVAPNIRTTLVQFATANGVTTTKSPVVPGRWTLTNTSAPDGSSSSTLTFVPLTQMPPGSTLNVIWDSGLKGFNGRPVPNGDFKWPVDPTGLTTPVSTTLEPFTVTTMSDTAVTTALWGTDGCASGALSGASSGISGVPNPAGGSSLTVATNGTTTLTLATNNYSTITVNKGGTLVLDSQSGPISVLATGAILINGAVVFKGQDGYHGAHGYTSYPYVYYGPSTAGTRKGGQGRNGGGSGGDSQSTNNTNYNNAGSDGADGTLASGSKGQGGQVPTSTATSIYSRYYYGAGGGAGGGHSHTGLAGGRAMTQYSASNGYGAASTPGNAGGEAFFANGVSGGGGGGGGGSVSYPSLSYIQGGGGGAGAGACTIATNTTLTLSASGLIDGRGGNGGTAAHGGGAGGGGAGGGLRIIAKTKAILDGVIDLRGGQGGAHGFGQIESVWYSNAANEKPARQGGDGSPGRLVVLAPNYVSMDEVRVYGQLIVKQIASLPTSSLTASAPPFGLDGNVTTTTVNFGSTSSVRYTSLTVASGATVDLMGTSNLQIFVDGNISIAGTLRLNGDSAHAQGQMLNYRPRFPDGQTYYYYPTIFSAGDAGTGMAGNLGGGNGGNGFTNGSYANGREAGNGTGPAPGVHNMNTSTGWSYYGNWYHFTGDSGGSGGANATDGGDGWACYAVGAAYNYLGAANDTSGTGNQRQSGAATPTFPKRLGVATTDPTLITHTNLSSFQGSGGGGGNSGGDTYAGEYFGMAGLGGGGAGAVALVNTNIANSVSVTGTIEARGGDGQTPGVAGYWIYNAGGDSAHAGGGGGSGGTVYIASNAVTIGAVTPSTGTGGATFDMRGGFGGGYRSQNQYANLQAYPEYMSTGGFGGNGGYGRLVLALRTGGTLNGVTVSSTQSGKDLANRWGMEQTSIDSASRTYKTLAGTARFYCPGLSSGGSVAQSKWHDLRSLSPRVDSFSAGSVQNATLTLRVEGAQSLPNTPGTGGTGDADPANTSGQFIVTGSNPVPLLQGWRWFRWRGDFTKTTGSTGGAVAIDNMNIVYTSDF